MGREPEMDRGWELEGVCMSELGWGGVREKKRRRDISRERKNGERPMQ